LFLSGRWLPFAMHFKISPITAAQIFNDILGEEYMESRIFGGKAYGCNSRQSWHTDGQFSIIVDTPGVMSEIDCPVTEFRASKIVRDTESQLRQWTDALNRQKIVDAARTAEMRAEMRDKFRAMANRHMWRAANGGK
jgi:hypothetical protein